MSNLFHPLLAMIASATESELAKYVEYIKRENRILRSRVPGQVHTTADERKQLLEVGRGLGKAIHQLVTIVSPRTFLRWCREEQKAPAPRAKKGRPTKNRDIRALVVKIATDTGFGYTRICGEMTKLGIRISRQTVRNNLTDEGIQD